MDIAVVIPVLNGERHIRETLDSVFAQTFQPCEVVVVDDGSTDRTREVVRGYEEVTLLANPGTGPGTARNYGAHHTTSEAVAFLDHDDLWHPEHLCLLRSLLQDHPTSPVASARRCTFSNSEKPNYSHVDEEAAITLYNPWTDFPLNNVREPVCHLIRRRALEMIDGWSPAFDGCADYHLLLKLALLGPFARTQNTTAAYRIRDDSYFRRLTTERGHRHYALRVAACKDALNMRKEMGLSTDQHLHRWKATDALATMMSAWIQGDESCFRQAVRRFDSRIDHLATDTVDGIRRQFYSFVAPHLRSVYDTEFAEEAISWLRQWPSDAARARRAMPWWALSQFPTTDLIRRSLFQPSVWPYVISHIARRMRARIALP